LRKPPHAQAPRGFANEQHFRVCGGIGTRFLFILRFEHKPVADEDRTNRYVAVVCGFVGKLDRAAKILLVGRHRKQIRA
jgi:hypothetical protein